MGDSLEARNYAARDAVVLHRPSASVISEDGTATLLCMDAPAFLYHARSRRIPAGDQAEPDWQQEVARC